MEPIDVYIGKRLKRSAAWLKSPINGRVRLLQAVEHPERALTRTPILPGKDRFEITKTNMFQIRSLDLSLIYTLQPGIFNLRLLL